MLSQYNSFLNKADEILSGKRIDIVYDESLNSAISEILNRIVEISSMQKEVAEALGISVSCYGGYEQGYREPDLKTLIKLCRFFDVSSDYLLGIEE